MNSWVLRMLEQGVVPSVSPLSSRGRMCLKDSKMSFQKKKKKSKKHRKGGPGRTRRSSDVSSQGTKAQTSP